MTLDILKALAFTVFSVLVMQLCGTWWLIEGPMDMTWFYERSYFLTCFLQLVVFLLLLSALKGNAFVDIRKAEGRYYVLGVILGLSYIFLQTPISMLYNTCFGTDHELSYNFNLARLNSFNALAIITFAPIAEEFFFRKFIQGSLLGRTTYWIAIPLSALLFGAVHLDFLGAIIFNAPLDFYRAFIATCGGLIAAILYQRSQSVGPAIAMHICWNFGAWVM